MSEMFITPSDLVKIVHTAADGKPEDADNVLMWLQQAFTNLAVQRGVLSAAMVWSLWEAWSAYLRNPKAMAEVKIESPSDMLMHILDGETETISRGTFSQVSGIVEHIFPHLANDKERLELLCRGRVSVMARALPAMRALNKGLNRGDIAPDEYLEMRDEIIETIRSDLPVAAATERFGAIRNSIAEQKPDGHVWGATVLPDGRKLVVIIYNDGNTQLPPSVTRGAHSDELSTPEGIVRTIAAQFPKTMKLPKP